ncbi:MAG: hypothetical protein ACYDHN_12570 [Solirubrobacteraceae bacterium]
MAVFALTAAASASAHEFEFSGTVPAALSGKQLNNQKFKVTAGLVTCEEAAASGTISAKVAKIQTVKVKYSKCEAFGTKAVITEAEYSFNAEGTVSVVGSPIIITSTTGKCSVKVTPTGNANLHTVKYTNKGTSLVTKAEVVGINYEPLGAALCGTSGAKETNGSYEGEVVTTAAGGTVSWK